MKKFLAILMIVCFMASALSVTSFAALLETFDAPPVGVVLRVSGLKKDGTTTPDTVKDYHNFVDGWNAAIEAALSNNHDRIVVDFYADWVATEGEFCDDGIGFSYDAIYVPEDVRITLNLGGHTINRAMTEWEYNGEVMFIDENADVIINEGTITGGWSCNGAGGIHVVDDAKLTLNGVNIVGNTTDDDDGGGIALYDGATLIVNGGSFKDNRLIGSASQSYGGAVYVNGSTAIFNDVTFENNMSDTDNRYGVTISVHESQVTLNNCTFKGNGLAASDNSTRDDLSVIFAQSSTLTVSNSTFNNNRSASMFFISNSTLTMDTCVFNGITDTAWLIKSNKLSSFYVTDTVFSDNNSCVVSGAGTVNDYQDDSFFRNCTFDGTNSKDGAVTRLMKGITFYDCKFPDFDVEQRYHKYIKLVHSTVSKAEATISVSGVHADGEVAFTDYYKDSASGWKAATTSAETGVYDHVVVDLYADWNTSAMDAVNIPANVKMILNLNGHKIDRSTENGNSDGEVVYVSANADVIINDGTITGGNGRTGAGGIHIKDNARVVLNNVNVDDNSASGTNGAAIAVYNGATLMMNGGSISDNVMDADMIVILLPLIPLYPYGTLYVEDATATLNNVTISDNRSGNIDCEGAAIYADNSTVTLNDCVVSGNINAQSSYYAESVVGAENSTLIINNTDFIDNGSIRDTTDSDYCVLFELDNSKLTMEGGKITDNHADKIFYFDDSEADIKDVTITDNASVILDVDNDSKKVALTECTLGNNSPIQYDKDILVDTEGTLILTNCDLGDTTFEDKSMVAGMGAGSIVGEGSLTMIVALLSLVVSGTAIFFIIDMKKKLDLALADKKVENE